jgi:hypothetical protein
MKPLNKRINRKKASKLTLKTRRRHHRLALNDPHMMASDIPATIRPEDVKTHQHY